MFKPLTKMILAFCLSLALIGQGLANVSMMDKMDCSEPKPTRVATQVGAESAKPHFGSHHNVEHRDSESDSNSGDKNKDVGDHYAMGHANMSHQQNMELASQNINEHVDCCGLDCQCPTSACSTLVMQVPVATGIYPKSQHMVNSLTNVLLLTHFNNHLYRPPIFA